MIKGIFKNNKAIVLDVFEFSRLIKWYALSYLIFNNSQTYNKRNMI